MVEPIMGEGGIKVIPNWCLKGLRKLCDQKKILLIVDEIQTGCSRTGKFFAFEYAKIKPDIVPIAKGLAGGYPIGAVLMTKKIAKAVKPGIHGSTFGGQPLQTKIGSIVMDIISNQIFLNDIKKNSKYFHDKLNEIKEKFPDIIKEVRGKGFLIGLKLYKDQSKFIEDLMQNKLLTIRAAENVIRILPHLNVKKKELNQALKIINKVCYKNK